MKKILLYTYKVYNAFNQLIFVSPVRGNIRAFIEEEYKDEKYFFNYGTMTIKGYKVDKVLTAGLGLKKRSNQQFIGPFTSHNYKPPPGPEVIGYYYNESKKNELNLFK